MKTKPLKRPICFLFSVLLLVNGTFSFAETANLKVSSEEDVRRSIFTAGIEGASLKTSSSLSGYGLAVGFGYGLSEKIQLQASLSQIFNSSGFSYLYTGLGVSVRYAVTGSFLSQRYRVRGDSGVMFEENKPRLNTFSIGAGAEQLLISGRTQVYPASGVTANLAYSFPLLGINWVASARYGSFRANQENFSAFFWNLSLPFDL